MAMTTQYPLAVMQTVWRRLKKAKAGNIIGKTLTVDSLPRMSRVTRYLQVVVICIPLLFLTGRVLFELVGLWIN
jgi:hypothetical protein